MPVLPVPDPPGLSCGDDHAEELTHSPAFDQRPIFPRGTTRNETNMPIVSNEDFPDHAPADSLVPGQNQSSAVNWSSQPRSGDVHLPRFHDSAALILDPSTDRRMACVSSLSGNWETS